jgi:transposase InsO family protein
MDRRCGIGRRCRGPVPRLLPTEAWATLLDEGVYLGLISTFCRLLRQAWESRERRREATHPATVKPELVATEPNRVWSWDITKLRGLAKWTCDALVSRRVRRGGVDLVARSTPASPPFPSRRVWREPRL